ncbi:hypothetical protein [Desulfocicer niacini]
MSESVKIYIELSDDIREWMEDNYLSIEDILEKGDIDAQVEKEIIPCQDERSGRTKDLVPVILASGGAITAVLFALSHCMKTWINRPVHYTWEEMKEIRDENGKVIKKNGIPQMKSVRKHFVHDFSPERKKEKIDLDANVKGIHLKMDTEERHSKHPEK